MKMNYFYKKSLQMSKQLLMTILLMHQNTHKIHHQENDEMSCK
ncbi:hypothetical protein M8C21_032613 [Ambrosia artemisiifolia]|uniref:Uncharacterized protein n=1 Tax=Ambrosia artemisiifolia TaxID=4212 RepID=A0AAD5BRC0_AMBAR|nr:hypothetical protein M8C21_032613 [Ambrosia artemisiifolia]